MGVTASQLVQSSSENDILRMWRERPKNDRYLDGRLFSAESWAPFVVILIAICMMKMCLLVRMTEGPCRLLCLAKMRHLLSGVTARERPALLSILNSSFHTPVAPFK